MYSDVHSIFSFFHISKRISAILPQLFPDIFAINKLFSQMKIIVDFSSGVKEIFWKAGSRLEHNLRKCQEVLPQRLPGNCAEESHSVAFGPQANYTDCVTATCGRRITLRLQM
jgi:hypothetical protein